MPDGDKPEDLKREPGGANRDIPGLAGERSGGLAGSGRAAPARRFM